MRQDLRDNLYGNMSTALTRAKLKSGNKLLNISILETYVGYKMSQRRNL
jgi:hypothetical protein